MNGRNTGAFGLGGGTAVHGPRLRSSRPSCRPKQLRRPATQRGFTYIGILFVVAFLGVALAVIGQLWSISARRADEEQLLFVGDAYRVAIASYYRRARQYPRSLDELILDERFTPPVRHLRKVYADPLTRGTEWRLVTLPDGAITGVASTSTGKPLKVANFPPQYQAFDDAECYCDWEFVYVPPLQRFRGPTKGTRGTPSR